MKLYKVSYVRQDSGADAIDYVVADSMAVVENEYADIINVEFLGEVTILTPKAQLASEDK